MANLFTRFYFVTQTTKKIIFILQRICCPSNGSLRHPVDEVPNEVKEKFKDLEEATEGDAEPEREAACKARGGEEDFGNCS